MDIPKEEIRKSLLPFSRLYGLGVNFRNWLFDKNILKQKSFDLPIICVGNITVGGTGKTPHIEYLIKLLSPRYRIGVVSRGYKRKSRGLREVTVDSNVLEVGDEPLQIKRKFPNVKVVVDGNRVNAIERLRDLPTDDRPEVILLDDGFQHRYVKPTLSILLVDSGRPVFEDKLLPAGNLREPIKGLSRASIVLVTKCSDDMMPIDKRIYSNGLNLFSYQELYFTTFDYEELMPVFEEYDHEHFEPEDLLKKHIILVTGIANPKPLEEHLEHKTFNLYTISFPDHQNFTREDISSIMDLVESVDDDNKIVITTEKDAMRFMELSDLPEDLKKILYYIPVKIKFIESRERHLFNKKILEHVRNYQTNG
ncbi:MAG: tetraacyldisaccharide 4'-kinase [Fermentimonas sp.]|jgi:tetraacyldisaccharide 4'-kinase